jgi:hypothetical protein
MVPSDILFLFSKYSNINLELSRKYSFFFDFVSLIFSVSSLILSSMSNFCSTVNSPQLSINFFLTLDVQF